MDEATYRGSVYPSQCDHMSHMNVQWYVAKFDEANWNMFARIGLTPATLREGPAFVAAVQQTITYKRELHAGDVVEVRSRLLELRERTVRFLHEMRNGATGELAASCEIIAAHVDKIARKACPFPPHVRARAAALLPAEAPAGA